MKEHTRDRFPIQVRKGHAVVKIYQVKNRNALSYCVSYVGPTGRQRRNFVDLDLAKREAANVAQHLADGDMEALKLTGREKTTALKPSAIAATGCCRIQSLAISTGSTSWVVHIVEAALVKTVDVDLPQVGAEQV